MTRRLVFQSMNSFRKELLSLCRNFFSARCVIFIHVMSTICGGTVSQALPAGVKDGTVSRKGQVLGPWWTEKIVLNQNSATSTPQTPSELSEMNLIKKIRYSMLSLKGDFMDPTGSSVRYDLIKESPKFQEYLVLVRQLEYVNLREMGTLERRAFLINIYNSLVIHALVQGMLKKFPGGSLSRIQLYASASYNIGGDIYSLNEIENGLLRGNRKSAAPFTKIPFDSPADSRRTVMLGCDPRIHFALNCGAVSCPPIAVYSGEDLDSQLDDATKGFLEDNTTVNTEDNSISLSMLFKWYKEDFGETDEGIVQWIRAQAPEKLLKAIETLKAPTLKYPSYNWDLNNKS